LYIYVTIIFSCITIINLLLALLYYLLLSLKLIFLNLDQGKCA